MLLTKLGTPAFLFPDPTDLSQFYPTGEQKLSFSNVSPRVGIELHPTERIMLYGSFSKGFKSGSWTTRVAAPVPPDPTKPADKQAPSFRSEEHTSELQSLMRISYAVFCLKTKNKQRNKTHRTYTQE